MRPLLRSLTWIFSCLLVVAAAAYAWAAWYPLPIAQAGYAFDVKPGASLRSVAHELREAGVIPADWMLVALGRGTGVDRNIKAGNYELGAGTTLLGLFSKLSQGDMTQRAFTIVEGWNFHDLREALKSDSGVNIVVCDLSDADLMHRIGASEPQPEGLFFPDTYFFAKGASDASLLARAYNLMRRRLSAAWEQRAPDLPLASPYQALILASIVEKETGRAADRTLIAAVFINRLRQGMRLQTDPSVIYGLGGRFDGLLHKRDLDADQAFNTYTREGLPPTPIAIPSMASLDAVLHPPASPYLYFVSRGDGTSEFSTTLADHNRAVAKYQRNNTQ